jgi:hypothetical protein
VARFNCGAQAPEGFSRSEAGSHAGEADRLSCQPGKCNAQPVAVERQIAEFDILVDIIEPDRAEQIATLAADKGITRFSRGEDGARAYVDRGVSKIGMSPGERRLGAEGQPFATDAEIVRNLKRLLLVEIRCCVGCNLSSIAKTGKTEELRPR